MVEHPECQQRALDAVTQDGRRHRGAVAVAVVESRLEPDPIPTAADIETVDAGVANVGVAGVDPAVDDGHTDARPTHGDP